MIEQSEFLDKYNISADSFEETKLTWAALEKIDRDHSKNTSNLTRAGKALLEYVQEIPRVHSFKMRVKEPEHLLEKIIRKKIENPAGDITVENYKEKITDLVGVRALHLFKDDWIEIDHAIKDTWEPLHTPVANIREGDERTQFEEQGCEIQVRDAGYRCVHYIVESGTAKKPAVVELQVRTIFEEGWSEIDHLIRYPYEQSNPILLGYLSLFNRLAGTADEMGSYIKLLQSHLKEKEQIYQQALRELQESKAGLPAEGPAVRKVESAISTLKRINPVMTPLDVLSWGGGIEYPNLFNSMRTRGKAQRNLRTTRVIPRQSFCKQCKGPLTPLETADESRVCTKCLSGRT